MGKSLKKLSSLSVFFPSFNDAKIIPYLVSKTYATLPRAARQYEVIVINDGSTDESREVFFNLKKQYPHFRIVEHKKNKGYGGALQSGFKTAKYDWIFYTDGDGQYDPAELVNLVRKITDKVDVINGYKMKRHDPIIRQLTGYMNNAMIQLLYHPPIRDIDCDFRLIRKNKLRNVSFASRSGLICLELIQLLVKNRAHFREVPVHHYPRPVGRSEFFKLPHLLTTLKEHVVYYTKHKHV